jgi:hypothetical protein
VAVHIVATEMCQLMVLALAKKLGIHDFMENREVRHNFCMFCVLEERIKCLLAAGCEFLESNKVVAEINEEYDV